MFPVLCTSCESESMVSRIVVEKSCLTHYLEIDLASRPGNVRSPVMAVYRIFLVYVELEKLDVRTTSVVLESA